MHELFIQASVTNEACSGLLAVIQGLCAMTPVHKTEYRVLYKGPDSLPFSSIGKDLSTRKPQNHTLWRELDSQLAKQSYYLTAIYEVSSHDSNDGIISTDEQVLSPSIEANEGNLLFVDFPGPPGRRSFNSRLAIKLNNESQIPTFLLKARYVRTKGYLREVYYAYRDNTAFSLHRDFSRTSLQKAGQEDTGPRSSNFMAFDLEMKWILTATVEVSDGNKPELVNIGAGQLEQARHDLQGIVDFVPITRQKLDTRVQMKR